MLENPRPSSVYKIIISTIKFRYDVKFIIITVTKPYEWKVLIQILCSKKNFF